MSSTVPLKKQSPAWLKQLIKVSAVITVFGFIPWDKVFSLEIRDNTLAVLMGGTVGLSGLFLLLCFLLIRVMQYDKWFTGLSMLLAPFVLMGIAFIWFISLFGPAKWQGQAIYQNGNTYLILEGISYGRDGEMQYRLISTSSLNGSVRHIQEESRIATNLDRFDGNKLIHAGKIWHKQPLAIIH